MSASNEKNTPDEQKVSRTGARTAREAKQRKEEKRSNLLYIVVAILFVIVAVISITWKSGIVQRKATAATINGVNYSAAEVEYYYKNAYQNFMSTYSSYASYLGLDTSKDLRAQECSMSDDVGTWYDYFVQQGLQQMSDIHALCDAADADGFTWNDEMQSELDSNLASVESAASNYGYTMEQYISAVYGSLVSKSVYEAQAKLSILAQTYANQYSDSLTYSDADLQKAYTDDANTFDVVDYKAFVIDGSIDTSEVSSDASSSAEATEPTEEEKAAALNDAKTLADSIYDSYTAGADVNTLASENEGALIFDDKTASAYSDSVLMNWLFDTARKSGDAEVLFDESSSTYYMAIFGSRYRQEYNTVDVRQILIAPEETTLKEGDEGYEDDVAEKKADAEKKANDLLAEWKAGEATEDSFATLANENSTDTGSNTKGGLYEQVYQGEMVANFNDWCFDASRKTGDTGVVESDYGYHIMYFVGTDVPYWKVQVTNTLKNNDFNDWYTEKTADYTAEMQSFGMKFIG
jgi:hypothetical protein